MAVSRTALSLLTAGLLGGAAALGAANLIDDGSSAAVTSTVTAGSAPIRAAVTVTAPAPGGSAAPSPQSGAAQPATNAIEQVADASLPSVAVVDARSGNANAVGGGQEALGTGWVLDPAGFLVTNDHVIEGSNDVSVRFSSGAPIKATVVSADPSSDLAVLKIEPPAGGLKALPLADSDQVKVGETAIAIGSPFGLDQTVTAGIVSSLGRSIPSLNQDFQTAGAIQTDASINPGNSGGPLLNDAGQVIGVNSQIRNGGQGSSGGNVGIGFAIPSNLVKRVTDVLKTGREMRYAYLGISSGEDPKTGAVTVGTVVPGGPADQAGVQQCDVVTKVGATPVTKAADISVTILDLAPGDRTDLTVTRNGQEKTLPVTLGERPVKQTTDTAPSTPAGPDPCTP